MTKKINQTNETKTRAKQTKEKERNLPTQNTADYFPLKDFQQTVLDSFQAISNVKKDS